MQKEMYRTDLIDYLNTQKQRRKEERTQVRDRRIAEMVIMAFLAFTCIAWGIVAW